MVLLLVCLEEVTLVVVVQEVIPQCAPAKEGQGTRTTWDRAGCSLGILAEIGVKVCFDLVFFSVPLLCHEREKCLHGFHGNPSEAENSLP